MFSVPGFFTGSKTQELTSWGNIVKDLITINQFLLEMRHLSKGDLFLEDADIAKVENLARNIAKIDFKV